MLPWREQAHMAAQHALQGEQQQPPNLGPVCNNPHYPCCPCCDPCCCPCRLCACRPLHPAATLECMAHQREPHACPRTPVPHLQATMQGQRQARRGCGMTRTPSVTSNGSSSAMTRLAWPPVSLTSITALADTVFRSAAPPPPGARDGDPYPAAGHHPELPLPEDARKSLGARVCGALGGGGGEGSAWQDLPWLHRGGIRPPGAHPARPRCMHSPIVALPPPDSHWTPPSLDCLRRKGGATPLTPPYYPPPLSLHLAR